MPSAVYEAEDLLIHKTYNIQQPSLNQSLTANSYDSEDGIQGFRDEGIEL